MKKGMFNLFAVILFVVLFQFKFVFPQQKQDHSHSHTDQKQYEQREERYRVRMYWQMPKRVLNELGVEPGQIIGDVGCGIGYFSWQLAKIVGESGKVFASDIDKGALQYLEERCKEQNIQNIQIIHGEENNPLLPKVNFDLVLIVNTIHFVDDPSLFLNNIKSCLKSNGRVAIIQWDAEKMDSELPGWSSDDRKKYTKQTILRTIYDADYEIIQMLDFLPMQMIYICQPRTKNKSDIPVLNGPYLGQKAPGMIPEIFAPDVVSTGMNEAALIFSPDGKSLYYSITHLTHRYAAIVFTEQKNGQWIKPQVASFSGKFNDSDAFFSYDGRKLFFTSDRPTKNEGVSGNLDIWVVERKKTGWSEPKNLGAVINSEYVDVNPCVTRNGTLYFASNRSGGFGSHDVYHSLFKNGKYTEPENLGDSINTSNFESSPFVSPDESYIIFNVFAQEKGEITSGLHISFKKSDGTWSKVINMGKKINDLKPAMFAFVTNDGRYLFFTNTKVPYLPYTGKSLTYEEIVKMFNSPQNGSGDIYWVDAKILEELKSLK